MNSKNCLYLTFLAVFWKSHSKGLSLLDLNRSSDSLKNLSLRDISGKHLLENVLISKLPEAMINN
jgi:hypothetical protein